CLFFPAQVPSAVCWIEAFIWWTRCPRSLSLVRLRALSVSLLRTPGDGGIDAETKLSASCSVCLHNVCKFSVSVCSVWSCVLNVCVCMCVCICVCVCVCVLIL